ncbi:hypothetical protein Taro_001306, partial [Colocasia esculenta]|nr:hypothetical protein [Colocasia esculenta]
LAPSSGSRQGDCRDVVPIASMFGSAWDCDRGYVAFLKTTYPLSPSGLIDGAMGYVAFLNATWPMSPSHRGCDRAYVAFRMRQGLCRIEKATGPMSPSQSKGRLLPLPGTPVLGSLLREYSGLRVCSSWQPPDELRSLGENDGETSQQRQGARRAEETGW